MAKEQNFSRVKVVVDDQYERFNLNEDFTGVTFRIDEDEAGKKVAKAVIPKKRKNPDPTPPQNLTPVEDVDWGYYKNKKGVVFKMNVNDELLVTNGVDWAVGKFRQATAQYIEQLKAKRMKA